MTVSPAVDRPAVDVAALPKVERRAAALAAAASGEPDALWALVEGFMARRSESGALTSRHTLVSYRSGLRAMLARMEGRAILEIDPDDAQDIVRSLVAEGYALGTVRSRIAAVSALYRALRWCGACEGNPFDDVAVPRDARHSIEKRPPYDEAYLGRVADLLRAEIRDEANAHRARSMERFALLILLWHAGLRIDEALSLRWADVALDAEDPHLVVRSGKGRKSRSVPLSARLTHALRGYRGLPRRASHGIDYVMPYRTWASAASHLRPVFEAASVSLREEAGSGPHGPVEAFRGFHAIRKRMGTRLYEELGDFVAVAEVLGHADIQTTRSYVRVGTARARRAITDW